MTPPFPDKKYELIYADPPWPLTAGPRVSGGTSLPLPYKTMTIQAIKNLPVASISEKESILFIWLVNKYIKEGYEIADTWGFKPISLITWCKPKHGLGLGGAFIQTTEFLLYARKGRAQATKRIDTTWIYEKRGRHSEKPKIFRDVINDVFPDRSKIELFARERFDGWDAWGDEV